MPKKNVPRAIAFTDGHLVYCHLCFKVCFKDHGPLTEGASLPNWLPFGPILERDDLPQKSCDRCDKFFDE